MYPSLIEKAAALFHSLIANHPFHNGNKRCAVIAFDHFLLANGHYLLMMNGPMYELAKQTASYRERNVSHDDSMREILEGVGEWIVPFSALELEAKKPKTSAALKGLYPIILSVSGKIRANPLNIILQPDSN